MAEYGGIKNKSCREIAPVKTLTGHFYLPLQRLLVKSVGRNASHSFLFILLIMKRFNIIAVWLLSLILPAGAQSITWFQHIAPIIHTNCTPCHRPGEAGPFSLITYEDVAKRAAFVKKVTQSGYMPPWKPDPHYTAFVHERRLTSEQIAMIANWADHNMPKGRGENNEGIAGLQEGTLYSRKPDLILKMQHPFIVKGDNQERFVVFKIPFELPDSMNVEAIEFTSNNRKVVHHANYEIDAVPDMDINSTAEYVNLTEESRFKYDQYTPYRQHMKYYGGWIPGSTYEAYPEGMGWTMPKRGVVLLTMHYAPLGKEEENISGVQFFFTKKEIKRTVKVVSLGSGGIGEKEIDPFFFIPANAVKTFHLKVTTPADQSLLSVWPHMHYIGKDFKAFGVTPAGDTIHLVSIPDWDFKWQEMYWFPRLVHIPRGTVLTIEGTYDNTADNPANPNSPPRLIYSNGDMKATDEMMTLIMLFLPYEAGDETKKIY